MITSARAENLALLQGDVHVWKIALEDWGDEESSLASILSSDETERGDRFHAQHDRTMFIISHGVMRRVLALYTSGDPSSIRFEKATAGKPYLLAPPKSAVCFNLSHSGDMALLAVAMDEVGVDVEAVRNIPNWRELSRDVFSNQELEELDGMTEGAAERAFFTGWSRKEAFIKTVGDGLSMPLKSFSVSLSAGEPDIRQAPSGMDAASFSMLDIDLDSCYSAAVVLHGKLYNCRVMTAAPQELSAMESAGMAV